MPLSSSSLSLPLPTLLPYPLPPSLLPSRLGGGEYESARLLSSLMLDEFLRRGGAARRGGGVRLRLREYAGDRLLLRLALGLRAERRGGGDLERDELKDRGRRAIVDDCPGLLKRGGDREPDKERLCRCLGAVRRVGADRDRDLDLIGLPR